MLTNTRVLEELMSLWTQYAKDPAMKFPSGKTGLRDVFDNLVDMHFWGPKLSIPRQVAEDLILHKDIEIVNVEQIMFFRPVGQSVVISEESVTDSSLSLEMPNDVRTSRL